VTAGDAAPAAGYVDSPFAQFLGFQPGAPEETQATSRLVTEEHHLNPTGAIHGGALITLADNVATRMANEAQAGGPNEGKFMSGIDLHATFLSNQRGGTVIATARPVRVGRRVTVIRTQVTGDDGKLLLEGTTTHIPT
jgi:1,4-dihydroxy-2-naphthoyl-CoA hydrolase